MKISKLSKTIAIILCLAFLSSTIATASDNVIELSQEKIASQNISVQSKAVGKKYTVWFLITAVRSEPTPFGTIIDILFMKDKVTVLSNSSFYSYVKTENGTKGYVFSGLLTSSTKSNSAFSINDYINVYTGKTKTVTLKGVSDSDLLSWSVGDNDIISFDPQAKK